MMEIVCQATQSDEIQVKIRNKITIAKCMETNAVNYMTQTPFEMYEKTSGRTPLICASNHFLTHKRDCPWYGQVEE